MSKNRGGATHSPTPHRYAYTIVLDYGDRVKSIPIIVKTPLDLMGRVSKVLDKFPKEKLSDVSLVNNGVAHPRHYKRKVTEYKKHMLENQSEKDGDISHV